MSREIGSETDRFEAHPVLLVAGLLLAGLLAKVGLPIWGIGIAIALYPLGVMTKLLKPVFAKRPWAVAAGGHSTI